MDIITTNMTNLRKKSAPTTTEECRNKGVFERMEAALDKTEEAGRGLAAIQIGMPIRAAVIGPKGKRLRLINPVITRHGPEGAFPQEGCLSLPGVVVSMRRYHWMNIKYFDERGTEHEMGLRDIGAVAVQHEIDHMDGILITDREYLAKKRKTGRNESCPECLKEGIKIKYKKCKKHF